MADHLTCVSVVPRSQYKPPGLRKGVCRLNPAIIKRVSTSSLVRLSTILNTMSSLRSLSRGLKLTGKCGQTYVLRDPLTQRKGRGSNVWSAARENDPMDQFAVKQPDDDDGPGWPDFTKEMETQELLLRSGYIRRMIDVIPPALDSEPSCMVLEPFEKSLWSSRLRRPFSLEEIRSVMRSIAIGLGTIHHNNLVYTGLSPRRYQQ